MAKRAFFFHLLSWAFVCLLASTPLGALLGFMLGFVLVIFSAILTPSGAQALFGILGSLLVIGAMIVAIAGWLRAFKGDWHGAFGWWSTTVALTGITLTVALSMQMVRAPWPAWI